MAERPAQEGEGPSLVGLAKAWEKDDVIRQSALKNGQLLKWPDKKSWCDLFRDHSFQCEGVGPSLAVSLPKSEDPKDSQHRFAS